MENGFYFDFDLPRNLMPEDMELIEKRMRQIVQSKHEFTKTVISAEEAKKIFADQPYKLELIEGLEKGGMDEYGNPLNKKPEISIYQQDTFVDLCRGPHVQSTKEIKQDTFKLMSIAGAYWRGDEKNKQLQRVYGTAWENKKQLEEHLHNLEEAKKRDHRKLGKELEIYIFDDEIGLDILKCLLDTMRVLRTRFHPCLVRPLGLLVTFMEDSTSLSRRVEEGMRKLFGTLVFTAVIHKTVALAEAPSKGQCVLAYAPESRGAREYTIHLAVNHYAFVTD